jgi:hypothetical protein
MLVAVLKFHVTARTPLATYVTFNPAWLDHWPILGHVTNSVALVCLGRDWLDRLERSNVQLYWYAISVHIWLNHVDFRTSIYSKMSLMRLSDIDYWRWAMACIYALCNYA